MVSLARVRTFGAEVIDELKKVTWPDWPQLKNATVVIIVFVLFVALVIGLLDLTVSSAINLVLNLFAG